MTANINGLKPLLILDLWSLQESLFSMVSNDKSQLRLDDILKLAPGALGGFGSDFKCWEKHI